MIAAATRVAGQWLRHRLLPSTFAALRFVGGSRWSAGARPLWQASGLAVLIAATGLLLKPGLFADPTNPPGAADGHATLSLELAIHRVLWGLPSHYYVGPDLAATPRMQLIKPGSLSRPVLSMSPTVGEAPAIAASHLKPIRHNENALMLVDTALLQVWPQLTVGALIRAHTALKIACLAVFLLFLLRVGTSLLMSSALFQGALTLVAWINTTHPLSLYPFVLPVTLLLTACLGLVVSFGLYRRLSTAGLTLVLIGGLVAFLANLRTTYLLVALALTLCAGLIAWFDLWRQPAMTRRRLTAAVLVPCGGFFAGFLLFTHTFLGPIQAAVADVHTNRSYHLVMHPLVLGLALPPSPLSQREGIVWNDMCGLTLAQRMDPTVHYKDAHYESALFLYYLKLWLYDTSSMCQLYAAKVAMAGAHYFKQEPYLPLHDDHLFAWGLAAPRRLARGGWWLLVFVVIGLAGVASRRRLGAGPAFAVAALGTVGLLVLLESAIIMPCFFVQYQNTLLFSMFCTGLIVYQLPLDGALSVLGRVIPGPPGTAAALPCRLCGSVQQPWFVKRDRQLCRCPGCGLITVADGLVRTPDGRSIYEVDDENIFHQDGNETYYLDPTNLQSCAFKLKWIESFIPAGAKLLDAGANFGHFLKVAQDHYQAIGFDLSPQAVRWSREHFAVNNHAGSIEAPPAAVQGPFDGITCWDVIEHVPDPAAALASLHALLKPAGLLFLSTPDAGSLVARLLGKSWYYLDPIQHLNLFSRANLTCLLQQAGFEVLGYRSFGRYYRLQYVIDRIAQLYPSGPLGWLGRLAAVVAWPVRRLSLYLKCGDVMGIVARRAA